MAKRPAFKSQLGSQLGSILSRTWQQLEGVREVVVNRTKAGRVQLDLTLLRRKRKDALAELGEVVARLARSGRIDEADFPELSGPLAGVEEVEDKIEREQQRARNVAAGLPQDEDDYEAVPAGRRGARDEDDREEYDEDDGDGERSTRGEFDEDGDRARAAAGRRLRGEADYDDDADLGRAADDDDDDDDDDDEADEADDDDGAVARASAGADDDDADDLEGDREEYDDDDSDDDAPARRPAPAPASPTRGRR